MAAVELLEQDDSGQLVRQGHAPERESVVCAIELQPERPADDEAQIAPAAPPVFEKATESDRVELLPGAVEQRHERPLREPAGNLPVVSDLHQFESHIARQQLAVMLDVVGERITEPAHGDNDHPHDEILRAR